MCTCRLERAQNSEEDIQGVTSGKEDFISQFLSFGTISDHLPYLCTPVNKACWSQGRGSPTFREKLKPYVLVSFASLCIISKIILQAEEQPSGVECTLMAFSAAPAFSFLCTSILRTRDKDGQVAVSRETGSSSGFPRLSSPKGTGQGRSGSELGSAEKGRGTHEQPVAPDPVLIRSWWLEGWPLPWECGVGDQQPTTLKLHFPLNSRFAP